MRVQFKVTDPLLAPKRVHDNDAGFDLRAAHDAVLFSDNIIVVETGLSVAVPDGYVGLLCSRSGLALNDGVDIVNCPGIIDSGYRGELKVILRKVGYKPNMARIFHIKKYDRIAQLVIVPIPTIELEMVTELPPADRGTKGFGSSGVT
jgi:dUTP pyrophosphatase